MALPVGPAPATGVPAGFGVRLDPATTVTAGGRVLLGGDPFRILRLAADHAATVRAWSAGAPVAADTGAFARLLVGANLGRPLPPPGDVPPTTVVVPVRGRAAQLRRLLVVLRDEPNVVRTIVVDDASPVSGDIAAVAAFHGADLLRRQRRGGAAAARNDGLAAAATPLVAFLDSDCVPEPGWLAPLAAHLADPRVALVAPRIVALTDGPGPVAAYEAARSPLDRGDRPATVLPGGRVPFVPGAALLARVAALGVGFDARLRGGEDVDLVWRLVGAGWHVRYEPAARVAHDHRVTVGAWLARRAYYGATAGPLAQRHPGRARPLAISPWSAAAWAALLLRHPVIAAGITGVATGLLARRLQGVVPAPSATALHLAGVGTLRAGRVVADALVRQWWPLSVVTAATVPAARLPLGAALAAATALDAREATADPVRCALLRRLDDVAYGSGVWRSAVRTRTADPLLPDLRWRLRIDDADDQSCSSTGRGV